MTRPGTRTRLASAYVLSDTIVVVANHLTQAGFWLAGRPVVRLLPEATDAELGAAARAALQSGLAGVPTLKRAEYTPYLRDLAVAAGVRSWAALEKSARLCNVEQLPSGALRVVPHRHGGTRGDAAGYHELPEAAFEPGGNDDTAPRRSHPARDRAVTGPCRARGHLTSDGTDGATGIRL